MHGKMMSDPKNTATSEETMTMCLRLAEITITATANDDKPESVIRNWKCIECGSRDDRTVTPDWDAPRTPKGLQPAYWSCDDCGGVYSDNIRITKKD